MIDKNPGSKKAIQNNKQYLLNTISIYLSEKSIRKYDSFELEKYADNLIAFFTLLHETSISLKKTK